MDEVLAMLSGEAYVSGEKMSEALGVTRAAVWKRVRQLQDAGWPIVSGGRRGYRLLPHDRLEPETWQGALRTRAIGRGTVRYEASLPSTNTAVKDMFREGAPHGSLCLCEEQTAGRGRLGRTWVSPAGAGLWQSVLLLPSIPPERVSVLTFCAALAMAEALEETAGIDARIKWPNDLVCGGIKICGILLEASVEPGRVECVVMGVGLNVRPEAVPPELTGQAACVADFCAEVPPRRRILCAYLERLEHWTDAAEQGGFDAVAPALKARCVTLGSRVLVTPAAGGEPFAGTAADIGGDGSLLVRTDAGEERHVLAGDVSVRGVMGYA